MDTVNMTIETVNMGLLSYSVAATAIIAILIPALWYTTKNANKEWNDAVTFRVNAENASQRASTYLAELEHKKQQIAALQETITGVETALKKGLTKEVAAFGCQWKNKKEKEFGHGK